MSAVKKDLWVKLAGLAIMLTLISSSLVSGTYAKYVKEVTGSDTARVAKFAFNLKDGTNTVTQSQVGEAAFDIFSLAADSGLYDNGSGGTFIAPGTTGDFALTVENLSEVDVEASFVFTETNNDDVPVYYTIGADTQRYSSVLTGSYGTESYEDMAAFATAMSTATGTLDASDGTTATTKTVTVSWTWAFETAGTGQADTTDTALGIGGNASVTLAVAVTIAQID